MARPRVAAGGGLAAVAYVLRKGREAGGLLRLYRRLRSRNACKTCALGMGGQQGGLADEAGRFPEVCKKSVQAQASDMAAPITERYFRATPIAALAPEPRELGGGGEQPLRAPGEERRRDPPRGGQKVERLPEVVLEPSAQLVLVRGAKEDASSIGGASVDHLRERTPREERLRTLVGDLHHEEERRRPRHADPHRQAGPAPGEEERHTAQDAGEHEPGGPGQRVEVEARERRLDPGDEATGCEHHHAEGERGTRCQRADQPAEGDAGASVREQGSDEERRRR